MRYCVMYALLCYIEISRNLLLKAHSHRAKAEAKNSFDACRFTLILSAFANPQYFRFDPLDMYDTGFPWHFYLLFSCFSCSGKESSTLVCWYKIFFSSINSLFTKQAKFCYFHQFTNISAPPPSNSSPSLALSDTQARFVSIRHFFSFHLEPVHPMH